MWPVIQIPVKSQTDFSKNNVQTVFTLKENFVSQKKNQARVLKNFHEVEKNLLIAC